MRDARFVDLMEWITYVASEELLLESYREIKWG